MFLFLQLRRHWLLKFPGLCPFLLQSQLGFLFLVQRKLKVFLLWYLCPPLLKGTQKTWVFLCLRKELWFIQLIPCLVCLRRLKGLHPRRVLVSQMFLLQLCLLFLRLRLPSFLGLVFLFKVLQTRLSFLLFLLPKGPLFLQLWLLPSLPQ